MHGDAQRKNDRVLRAVSAFAAGIVWNSQEETKKEPRRGTLGRHRDFKWSGRSGGKPRGSVRSASAFKTPAFSINSNIYFWILSTQVNWQARRTDPRVPPP